MTAGIELGRNRIMRGTSPHPNPPPHAGEGVMISPPSLAGEGWVGVDTRLPSQVERGPLLGKRGGAGY